ncbi:cytochrome oxidase c subunit VIb-domain-containing protein [Mycena floridula]|nr:cytochrome oxidase c subunit VIb-domain-containing protein [Mycena floridula]KAJ7590483.1 cytochrome oxidase c subunit VIb-domain-containing protein [Mycena floridula]
MFFSSKKEEPNALSRTDRQKCWDARDAYFSCLDAAGVVRAGSEKDNACAAQSKAYSANCAKSWIEYFNQRRIIEDAQKARMSQATTQAANATRK